ncbi:hypothetical protein KAF44_25850 (plasmid) [Cupriavidus necator]|nr:hypothetical protein KAF44_25850 [Cupriavidus necator]
MQNAVNEAQETVRGLLEDPSAQIEIVHTLEVLDIIRGWGATAQLNWELARRKCSSTTKSCFIGIRTRDVVCILSLLRVSRAGELTTLLFLERDSANTEIAGLGFIAIDVVLDAVARYFESDLIVIDKPLKVVVPFYEANGYTKARMIGKTVSTMTRPAKKQ